MRYAFVLSGRPFAVDLQEHAEGPKFVVEGEAFEPKVQALGHGHYKVTIGNQKYEFKVQNGQVVEGVRPLDLEVRRDRPELERSKATGRKADGKVKPPMPGKVVEVKVAPGDKVKLGQTLLVLEAMKMQNDLKAPFAGTVARVSVQAGANVEASTVLLELTHEEKT
jgi:biotin carboxyl carrier protein